MQTATGEDFANDVEAQVKYLFTRSEIDHKKIALLGHSEGGIIAPMVAVRSKDIAFIVLIAGPAVSGDKIISKQIELLMRSGGATATEIKTELARQEEVYKVVRTNKGWDELRLELQKDAKESLDKMTAEERKAVGDEEKLINTSTDAKIKGAKSPWFKYFINFDPAKQLEKVKCPVLALFGELDMQVPPDLNKEPMEKVFKKSGNKDYTVQVFPKANHLFQEAKTGNPTEYATLKKEFVVGFLERITEWIKQRVK
jgi:pimeloyl-ACP methyl ester carboxylesterase